MEKFAISEKVKQFYNDFYDGPSEWRRLGAIDKSDNIIKLCNKYPHNSILEIGSGEGSVLQRLSDLEFPNKMFSLEISENAVEITNRRKIKSLIECKLFDGCNIPYEDNSFDLAILTHVLEHVEQPGQILLEAGRVAPCVFVEVPLEDNKRLKKEAAFSKSGHINFYSVKTIIELIQNSGFHILVQIITNSSYKIYKFQYGAIGILRYLMKETALKIFPSRVAAALFTYNCSLLCRKTEAKQK